MVDTRERLSLPTGVSVNYFSLALMRCVIEEAASPSPGKETGEVRVA